MSLSNIDKKHSNDLLKSLSLSKTYDHNSIEKIKSNSVNYGKLKLLKEQMDELKLKAEKIVDEAIFNEKLHNLKCNFIKKSGNTYHLYKKKNNQLIFSLISPKEWINCPYIFLNSYYYDFDKNFYLVDLIEEF